MSVYDYIAYQDGELGTIFGPCIGELQGDPGCCISCDHAAQLAAEGKDWDAEYRKWKEARKAQPGEGS